MSQPSPTTTALPECIIRLMAFFEEMNVESVEGLDKIYQPDLHFQDPVHEIHGLSSLEKYFTHLNKNLASCQFDFKSVDSTGDHFYIQWIMTARLKRPKKTIVLNGISVIEVSGELVAKQRDYFDLGEMVYEKVPLLGGIIRGIKRKLGKY